MPKISARQIKGIDILTESEAQDQYSSRGHNAGSSAPSSPVNGQIW